MTNPLSDYFRKPETTVVLPAGKWYAFGDIEFVNGNEVPVYSMLPAEEIMMINPEALVSGVAIIEILKSCCPSVKILANCFIQMLMRCYLVYIGLPMGVKLLKVLIARIVLKQKQSYFG